MVCAAVVFYHIYATETPTLQPKLQNTEKVRSGSKTRQVQEVIAAHSHLGTF
jgi:hypothetical protein